MSYDQLIQLYFERSNALQWYWTLYVVVIGGLLAISTLRLQRDLLAVGLVTVLYSSFAYKNLDAIHDVTVQRTATLQALKNFPTEDAQAGHSQSIRALLEPTLVQPSYDGIRNFHAACDVMTILLLWAIEWRRVRMSKDPTKTRAVV